MAKPPEEHPFGIRLEWWAEGRVAVISTEGRMEQEAIDAWADLVLRVLREWPPGERAFVLFNNTGQHQGFTPYAIARTRRLYQEAPPALSGCAAIVLRPTWLMSHLRFVLQLEANRVSGRLRQRFFTSVDDAYAWLCIQIEQP